MYERKRRAVDMAGNRWELTELQESDFVETPGGEVKYQSPAKFFAPDGKQLIPEGNGFFRTAFGIRFKVIE